MIRLPPASRALIAFPKPILGLTPQALRWRPLRGLSELRFSRSCDSPLSLPVLTSVLSGYVNLRRFSGGSSLCFEHRFDQLQRSAHSFGGGRFLPARDLGISRLVQAVAPNL